MQGLPTFEHQVAGSHSASSSQLLRGHYGQVLKPYKLLPQTADGATLAAGTQPNKGDNTENGAVLEHGPVCTHERGFYELCNNHKQEHEQRGMQVEHDAEQEHEEPCDRRDQHDGARFQSYEPYEYSEQLRELRVLIPRYYGPAIVNVGDTPTPHLVLEDLTLHCRFPCVTDLKMGANTHYPGRKARGTKDQPCKYPSLPTLGWCVAGMRQRTPTGAILTDFGPTVGRTLSSDQVQGYLKSFLEVSPTAPSDRRKRLLQEVTKGLSDVLHWFEGQRLFWFRSSSILIVYNAEHFQLTDKEHTPESGVEGSAENHARTGLLTCKDVKEHTPETGVEGSAEDHARTGLLKCGDVQVQSHQVEKQFTLFNEECLEQCNLDVSLSQNDTKTNINSERLRVSNEIDMSSNTADDSSLLHQIKSFTSNSESSAPSASEQKSTSVLCASVSSSCEGVIRFKNVRHPQESACRHILSQTNNSHLLDHLNQPETSRCRQGSVHHKDLHSFEVPDPPNKGSLQRLKHSDFNDFAKELQSAEELQPSRNFCCMKDSGCCPGSPSFEEPHLHQDLHPTETTLAPLVVRVKMIDFAHVLGASGEPDSNYMHGLENILRLLRDCRSE